MPRAGLVSYDGLPIASGGAHRLRRLRPKQAWEATVGFLRDCTTADLPRRLTLSINSVEGVEPSLPDSLRESAVVALGLHRSPHEERGYGNVKGNTQTWHLSPNQAAAAASWRDSLGPLPVDWLGGPAVVSVDFGFRLRHANSGEELPFQGTTHYLGQVYDGYGVLLGESGCRLNLGSRNTLSVLLFLPFEDVDAELWSYVAFLQSRLPFQLSSKHWKHWRLTKRGSSYVDRRIAKPDLGPGAAAEQGDEADER